MIKVFAHIVQLVEQLFRIQKVEGSNPSMGSTSFFEDLNGRKYTFHPGYTETSHPNGYMD